MATSELSKVEVKGFEARHYDLLLNLISFGLYSGMVSRAIAALQIQPGEKILDFGCGTGSMAEKMAQYLGPEGRVVGFDIGEEMLEQAYRRQQKDPRLSFHRQRIDDPLPEPFHGQFDRVFISFVLHGFEQPDRLLIIDNAYKALRPGGIFSILDWHEFDLNRQSFPVRWGFTHLECPLATDFISHDWKAILSEKGFGAFQETLFFRGKVRLLQGKKQSQNSGLQS